MSKKLYEESNIQEIASAIREKNEVASGSPSSETYRAVDMAPAIRKLPVINPSNYRTAAEQDVIDNAQNNNISQLREDVYDSTVGLDTKAPAIYKSDSGDIVSFYDGADSMPLKNLTVNFEPQQDLHGYDHPWPAGGGKNILPISMDNESSVEGGVTVTVVRDADGNAIGINLNGTCTNSTTVYITGTTGEQGAVEPRTITLSPGEYYLLLADGGAGAAVRGAGNWKGWKAVDRYSSVPPVIKEVTEDSPTEYTTGSIAIYLFSGNTYSNVTIKPMICSVSDVTTVDSKGNTVIDYTFSPYSNICPIEGYTGCNITRAGKNLLPFTESTQTISGITFVVNSDGSVTANGTATDTAQLYLSFFNLEGNYYFTGCAYTSDKSIGIYAWDTSSNARFKKWDSTSASDSNYDLYTLTPFKVPKGHNGVIAICIKSGTVVDNVTFYPMICAATETDPTFEPYQGQTYPISWQTEAGTVYDGSLDAITGLLTVDRALVDLGLQSWGSSTSSYFEIKKSDIAAKIGTTSSILCSCYPYKSKSSTLDHYCIQTTSFIRFYDSVYDDVESFVSAVTGQTIVFYLEEPQVYHLTPQQITTLLGTNNIWSDIGPIELTYPADTKTYVDNYQTDDIDSLQEMSSFFEPIPGTTETVSFDQNGKPASIVHTNGTDALRTDSFVWTDNTVTETRTLANGKHIVMATDLTTLVTTISEIQEGT